MNIVKTPEGVFTLTKTILKADSQAGEGRQTYLQSLVAATQDALGATPRTRAGRGVKLDEEGIKAQLAALVSTHDAFYEQVIAACSEDLPGPTLRAKELNRRSNFARTALYSVRAWIKSGRDITALVAAKVTKGNIMVKREPVAPTPRRLARKVERGVTELIDVVTTLAAQDKAAAVSQLEHALSLITNSLAALGTSATRDPAKALAEHIPLKIKTGMFIPVHGNGGVQRAQA